MGKFMREYWIPALMPEEVPVPDGPPVRLRLLNENLIAFRNTSGQVGIIQNACPHRGASLFFGRNEEDGLRCVYHGWKFDVTGACIDMPSEPAESNFKNKVRAKAYPCIERNGIIWTYMGPREVLPPLPDLLPNLHPECRVGKSMRECNYMQALEGDIDTIHFGFLHAGHVRPEDTAPRTPDYYAVKVRNAELKVIEHEIGATYGAYRPAEEDSYYWRISNFMLPFYTQNPTLLIGRKTMGNAWVPLDDEHVMVWSFNAPTPDGDQPGIGGLQPNQRRNGSNERLAMQMYGASDVRGFLPETTDWLGRFRPAQNLSNDYAVNREAQAQGLIYSGIPNGANPQDGAMQETMGPIYNRSQEHLGTTDAMVIRSRRKLLDSVRAHHDAGVTPPGVEKPELYRMRSGGLLAAPGVDGLELAKDIIFGRSLTVEGQETGIAQIV
jgi:phenylpropionate dioxygenase-like ring-hydroxylating dioxygenase large terminal subunit